MGVHPDAAERRPSSTQASPRYRRPAHQGILAKVTACPTIPTSSPSTSSKKAYLASSPEHDRHHRPPRSVCRSRAGFAQVDPTSTDIIIRPATWASQDAEKGKATALSADIDKGLHPLHRVKDGDIAGGRLDGGAAAPPGARTAGHQDRRNLRRHRQELRAHLLNPGMSHQHRPPAHHGMPIEAVDAISAGDTVSVNFEADPTRHHR